MVQQPQISGAVVVEPRQAAGFISVVGKAVLTNHPPLRPLGHNANLRDGAQPGHATCYIAIVVSECLYLIGPLLLHRNCFPVTYLSWLLESSVFVVLFVSLVLLLVTLSLACFLVVCRALRFLYLVLSFLFLSNPRYSVIMLRIIASAIARCLIIVNQCYSGLGIRSVR